MSEYIPTIGLEIHAELKTKTKMFCNSKNDTDEERPNWNVCPVCLAHPGTLPVINREAVRKVLQVGLALRGTLADYTEFDRKNYFYPDLPKGYQISQFAYPLVSGGELNGVQITRVHLEEDTASSIHSDAAAGAGDDATGATAIDYNRSGIPLMELVTEPVIHSAEAAGAFARELQLLLRYLGASEANMEKGEMRVEANVSVARATETFASADTRRPDAEPRRNNSSAPASFLRLSALSLRNSAVPLGTKVEIKNLNSFRIMERAVAYEIKRQQDLIESGEMVVQETRGWDEKKGATFAQRVKEGSADYRYFPDPDLPSLKLSELPEFSPERLRKDMPELPHERRARYISLGIKPEDAELYVRDQRLGVYFEAVVAAYTPKSRELILASNYIANDLVKIIRLRSAEARESGGEDGGASSRQVRDMEERDTETKHETMGLASSRVDVIPISVTYFQKIIEMISSNKISSRAAKDILSMSAKSKEDPENIAKIHGLLQTGTIPDIEAVIDTAIANNPKVVADYRAGKAASLQYLIGQCMKAMRGAADPVALRDLLLKKLS